MTALFAALWLAAVPVPADEFTGSPDAVDLPVPSPAAWARRPPAVAESAVELESNTGRWMGIFTSGLMGSAPSIGFGVVAVLRNSRDSGQMLVLAAALTPLSVIFPLMTGGLLGLSSWSDRLKASLLPLGGMVLGAATVALFSLPLVVMGLAAGGGGWNMLPAALFAVFGGAIAIPLGAIAGSALMATRLSGGVPGTRVRSSGASLSFAPIPGGGKVGLTVEL